MIRIRNSRITTVTPLLLVRRGPLRVHRGNVFSPTKGHAEVNHPLLR
jgi:hypothetical protein